MKDKVLVIVGPTAAGKSEAAVQAALALNGEIISADSMQVYRRMDIGTAKPDRWLLATVPHHLINVIEPDQEFSVAEFQALAREKVAELVKNGKLPIVVGGSGLYVRSIIDPLDFPTAEPGSEGRRRLEELARDQPEKLLDELRRVDPEAPEKIDIHNARRVIRAIEAALAGKNAGVRSERFRERHAVYDVLIVGLSLSRPALYSAIDRRVDEMIQAGLENEVADLLAPGRRISVTAGQALGYKEFIDYFEGRAELGQVVENIKRRTRRFAKRQLTWFKADPRIHWLDVESKDPGCTAKEIVELVKDRGFVVSS